MPTIPRRSRLVLVFICIVACAGAAAWFLRPSTELKQSAGQSERNARSLQSADSSPGSRKTEVAAGEPRPAADCCGGRDGTAHEPAGKTSAGAPAQPLPGRQIKPALDAFHMWAERYAAATAGEKAAMLPAGVALATKRVEAMGTLIRQDPKAAIEALLPYELRKALPPEIAERIEHRVSGVGDLMVLAVRPLPGETVAEPIYRTASLKGKEYRAYTYGKRLADISREKTPILGVGVTLADGNRLVAVRDEAYEVLEKAESADLRAQLGTVHPVCPVSGEPTEVRGDETAVDTGRKLVWLCSGGHMEQWLESPDGAPVLEAGGGGGSGGTSPVVPPTWTQGNKKLLAIRVRFADQAVGFQPSSDSQMQTELQKVVDALSDWSYGKLEATFAFTPTLDLPGTQADYASHGMSFLTSVARPLAAAYTDGTGAHPYDSANFDFDAVVFSTNVWGSYCGVAWVGAKGTMIKCASAGVYLHEWGHNFGLVHANFWAPSSDSPIGAGTHVEYGSKYSVMGSGGLNQFNTLERYDINWLGATDIVQVSTSGTYRLYNADKTTLTAGNPYALRVPKDSRVYFVEYRPNWNGTSHDFASDNGAMILWTQGDDELLDMTPLTSAGNGDASLVVGRSFNDSAAGITFTTVAKGGTAPDDYVDVVVNFNTATGNSPPVAVVTASNYTPATGVAITLTATAGDPDGDTLAYAWDFGDGNRSADNLAVQTKSWSSAGEYNVNCVVSDRKGKRSVQNTVIRVGTPSNFTISGRVTKSDGTPVQDMLIKDSNSVLTYTDANGQYTLSALGAGSYTVSAIHSGWAGLTAQFVNPIVIGPSATGVDFIANPPGPNGTITPPVTPPNTVTVAATDADANETVGDSGTFTISRTGSTASALEVFFGLTGTARYGTDFQATGVSATIPAGDSSTTVILAAIDDANPEPDETAILQLSPSVTYTLATTASAIVAIHDNDPTQVTIAATDANASETGGDTGTFTVTRTGATTNPLDVNFTIGGNASNGSDYPMLTSPVTIPAGQSTVPITITPINDGVIEPEETIILTLATGSGYTVSTPSAATVRILAQPGNGGGVLREWWDGIGGGVNVADLLANTNFPGNPTGRAIVTTAFESQQNRTDNFGERWRAIFTAPVSGNYVFYIASDDASELWMSADATPDRKTKIAYVSGWTNFQSWTQFPSQTSAAIALVAGQRYYMEAMYKEGGGGDHLSVGVQYPNGALERPIPAHRLDPFTPNTPLVAPWISQDIGAVPSAGSAGIASDTLPSAPKHRYSFTGTANASAANGATISDSIGAADAFVRGAGAVFDATGTSLRLPGGAASTQAYVDLPNGIVTGTYGGGTRYTSASYEAWLTVNTTQNWARIFDFGTSIAGEITAAGGTFNGTDTHHISLAASKGTTGDQQVARYYPSGTTDVTSDSTGTAINGTQVHVVLTYDAADQNWRWYRNGMLMQTLADAQGLTTINDLNNWLGRSMLSTDNNIDANFNEFRTYDYALTEAQLRGNFDAGPNVVNTTTNAVSGQYFVSGSGIIPTAGASDSFQLASQSLSGNWDIRARLVALSNSNSAARAGVMIREGTAANARHAFIGLTPDGAGHFTVRTTAGASATTTDLAGLAFPYWVRLVRLGDAIKGYVSSDGGTWVPLGATVTLTNLAAPVEYGFAVASGTNAAQATALAQFDNFSIAPSPSLWTNTTTGSSLAWTQSANWQSGGTAVSSATGTVEFFSGQPLAAGTVTANNDNAGTFQMSTLRLSGTGPAGGSATVSLTGGALQLTGTSPAVTLDALNGAGFTYAIGNTITLAGDTTVTGAGTATFVLNAELGGAGGLTKAGASTLTLAGNNSYAGTTTITAGTLAIGNGGATGSLGGGAVTNNGTLNFRRTDTGLVVPNAIGGSGGIAVNGATGSIVTLGSPNTFTGGVTVTTGALRITNSSALGGGAKTITVSNGAAGNSNLRLDGSGGDITLPATISFTTSNTNGAIVNEAGNNTIAGNFTMTSTANTKLLVNAGTLTVSGIVTANTGGRSLVLDGAGNGTFSGVLQNSSIPGLVKEGTGAWIISGANTYTGATAINVGTLVVNGTIDANGLVTVASGATLSGLGTIHSPVTVTGIHAPGNGVGIQAFTSSLNYGAASRLKWELIGNTVSGSGTSFDRVTGYGVAVTSGAAIDVVLNSAGSAVNFSDTFWNTARNWTVLTGSTVSGTFAIGSITNDAVGGVASNRGTFAVQQTSGAVTLTWTPFAPIVVWRNLQFGANAGNPAISGDFVDVDKDGIVNLMEYSLGLNPNAPSASGNPKVAIEGSYLTMTYTRSKAATDINLRPVWSTNLQTWSNSGVIVSIFSSNSTQYVTGLKARVLIGTDAKKFFRLEVTPP